MSELRRRRLLGGIGAMAFGLSGCGGDAPGGSGSGTGDSEPLTLGGRRLPAGLPPGRLVAPETAKQPVLWVSDQRLDELEAGRHWASLLTSHTETGLWPLLLGGSTQGDGRLNPWQTGDFKPEPPATQGDLNQLFRAQWEEWQPDDYHGPALKGEDKTFGPMPFSTWPGLADPVKSSADPDEHARSLARTAAGMDELVSDSGYVVPHLGLVAAPDGVTALYASGWFADTPQEPGVVFRSWEQRFGVRVCTLSGSSTVNVSVAWQPRTMDQAWRLTLEHYLFCPDNFNQAVEPFTFEDYAKWLMKATTWSFWWD